MQYYNSKHDSGKDRKRAKSIASLSPSLFFRNLQNFRHWLHVAYQLHIDELEPDSLSELLVEFCEDIKEGYWPGV